MTQRIVGTLISQISRAEVQRLLRKPPRNLQAYEFTLKGRALWLQSTQESIPEARRLLEQANAIDPSYAPAYVYAAFTYLTSYNNRWNEEFGQRQTIEQMADKARSAIRLDNDLRTRPCHLRRRSRISRKARGGPLRGGAGDRPEPE